MNIDKKNILKFIDWCIDKWGFLTTTLGLLISFWVLVNARINAFILHNIGTTLILSLLIIITVFCFITYQQYKIKKYLSLLILDSFIIESDEQTIFIDSPGNPYAITSNVAAVEADGSEDWKRLTNRYSREFDKAKWIADKKRCRAEEAKNGYSYIFERRFELERNILNKAQYIELILLTDDDCVVHLNGQFLGDFKDYGSLHSKRIDESMFRTGENVLKFTLTNAKNPDPTGSINDGNASEINPYGMKFLLEIEYQKLG